MAVGDSGEPQVFVLCIRRPKSKPIAGLDRCDLQKRVAVSSRVPFSFLGARRKRMPTPFCLVCVSDGAGRKQTRLKRFWWCLFLSLPDFPPPRWLFPSRMAQTVLPGRRSQAHAFLLSNGEFAYIDGWWLWPTGPPAAAWSWLLSVATASSIDNEGSWVYAGVSRTTREGGRRLE